MNEFDPDFEAEVKVHLQTLEEWRSGLRIEPTDYTVEGSPPSTAVLDILRKWFPELADEPRIADAAAELQKVFDEERVEAVHDALGG